MAAIVVTVASVLWSGARDTFIAGAALTRGMALYLDLTTNTLKALDADVAVSTVFAGWALSDAAAAQPIEVGIGDGELTIGGTPLTVGVSYFASPTAGGFGVRTEVTTGMFVAHLGVARTTAILRSGSVAYMSGVVAGIASA